MTGLDTVGAPTETATMTLYHPSTDEPLTDDSGNEMWIEVYGRDSGRYKQVQHSQVNRQIQKAQRSGGRPSLTAEQQEAQALELLARCTKDWHVVIGGETPDCKVEKVREVYQQFPWVREQVDAFMHDRKAFLTASSGT